MKYVSINGPIIRRNALHGTDDPPIRIARTPSDAKPVYAHEINILGSSKLVYSPDKPIMRCGARLVLMAQAVTVVR